MKNFLNVDDIPVLCENVPDYRKEAFEEAEKNAQVFGVAYVLFNGLYYHVTSSECARVGWGKKGYEVIHVAKLQRKGAER